jgi:hypothetical protein
MKKRRPPGDYPVGYGKPPAHGKIQPGERRNPSGRPPRPRAPDDIARKVLSEKVLIFDRGKRRHITRYEANIRNLYQMAIKGNVRAAAIIHEIGDRLGLTLPPVQDMRLTIQFVESDGHGRPKVVDPFTNDEPEQKGDKNP